MEIAGRQQTVVLAGLQLLYVQCAGVVGQPLQQPRKEGHLHFHVQQARRGFIFPPAASFLPGRMPVVTAKRNFARFCRWLSA